MVAANGPSTYGKIALVHGIWEALANETYWEGGILAILFILDWDGPLNSGPS